MARASTMQMAFPRFESQAVASPRGPDPRTERQADELQKAQHALLRMKEKKRIRSLKMELALAESEQQTENLLEAHRQAYERVEHDAQLEELLRLRKAGLSIQDALARVDGDRKPARSVASRNND